MRRDAGRVLDEYLAAAARAGDRKAHEMLARRWSPRLLRHASRLTGDIEMAREASQDAWADIIIGLPRLHDAAVFPAWAYRIVTRRCADAIRRAQRSRRNLAAYGREPRSESGEHASLELAADAPPLRRALAALPPDQRAAIALFYLEDLSIAEIAAAMSAPAGTIKTRLMHARRKLREALERAPDNGECYERT